MNRRFSNTPYFGTIGFSTMYICWKKSSNAYHFGLDWEPCTLLQTMVLAKMHLIVHSHNAHKWEIRGRPYMTSDGRGEGVSKKGKNNLTSYMDGPLLDSNLQPLWSKWSWFFPLWLVRFMIDFGFSDSQTIVS